VHLKLDTGMGRYGLSELPAPPAEVVGLMTHLATADSDLEFARAQLERFDASDAAYSHLTRHAANSAATLRLPESHFDAVRCGVAIYGLSPFNTRSDGRRARAGAVVAELPRAGEAAATRAEHRLRPALRRREPTWIGLVPVGYGDGFSRDLTGTEVRVAGELCPVVGTISMDSFAVRLPRELPEGAPVVLLGHGVLAESHAHAAGTINYELVCRVESGPLRARRTMIDA
jgi:alanine racemase